MTVGQRVTTNDRLIATGNIELKGQILSGLERRERFAVVRSKVKGINVVALFHLLRDLKFTDAVPKGFALFDLLELRGGGLDLQLEMLAGKASLLALEISGAQ